MHVDFNGYYNRVRVENAGPRDWVRSGAIAAGRRSVWLLGLYPHIFMRALHYRGEGGRKTSPKLSHCPPRYCNARAGGGALCYDGLSAIETCQDVAEKTPRSRSERTKDIGCTQPNTGRVSKPNAGRRQQP